MQASAKPRLLAGYAVRTPTVVFHAGVVSLSAGSGAERRKLLDRLALYRVRACSWTPMGMPRRSRARQRVLETRGEHARDLEEWEELAVRHGLALSCCRTRGSG